MTKRKVLIWQLAILFTSQLFTTSLSAQQYAGSWYGTLKTPFRDLLLVFHVDKNADGTLSAKMDSPDQNAFGLKMDTAYLAADSLNIKFAQAGILYKAKLLNDTALHGNFYQGAGIPLNMRHEELKVKPVLRPQTPKPPFAYNVLDTTYFNADKSIRFGATLTYPKDKKRFPVVLMITGSGAQDRDETLFDHKPFAVIADYLTQQGYAVLRVDDRGVGQTTGEFKGATTGDFAKDVLAGIAFLKTLPNIDPKKIGLVGHSEGGCLVAMVASQSKDVAFAVSLAGVGVSGKELSIRQGVDISTASGNLSPSDAAMTKQTLSIILNTVTSEPDQQKGLQKILADMDAYEKTIPDTTLKRLYEGSDSVKRNEQLVMMVSRFYDPWFKYFLDQQFADYWKKVTIPLLVVNGAKDLQVAAEVNTTAIRKAVESNGNKHVTVVVLPELNHLFQHCKTCTLREYADLEETLSPELLSTIGAWMKDNVKAQAL